VTHVCNHRYLGGRDQEHHSLRPAWQKVRTYLKKEEKITHHRKGLVEWLKLQGIYRKKKKEDRNNVTQMLPLLSLVCLSSVFFFFRNTYIHSYVYFKSCMG
jgi:hypothetical protein